MKPRARRLRGLALLVCMITAIDLSTNHLLLPYLNHSPMLYNPNGPELIEIVATLFTAILLVVYINRPWAVLFAGLLTGGYVANVLDLHLFGPVTDFIHRPGSDYYMNVADLFIGSSFVVLGLVIIISLRRRQLPL